MKPTEYLEKEKALRSPALLSLKSQDVAIIAEDKLVRKELFRLRKQKVADMARICDVFNDYEAKDTELMLGPEKEMFIDIYSALSAFNRKVDELFELAPREQPLEVLQ